VLFSTTVRHSADFGPHSIILASWSKTWSKTWSFAAGWSNGTWPLLNVHGETIASSWLSNVHIRTVLVTSLGTSKSRNQKSPNCGINAYRALLRSCIWLTKTASGCCVSNRHHIRSRYVLEIRRIWVIAPCVSATFSVRTVGQVLFWQLCLFVSVLTRQWASASPAMGHWGHVPPPPGACKFTPIWQFLFTYDSSEQWQIGSEHHTFFISVAARDSQSPKCP